MELLQQQLQSGGGGGVGGGGGDRENLNETVEVGAVGVRPLDLENPLEVGAELFRHLM